MRNAVAARAKKLPRIDVLLAFVLTVVGELEVLVGPADGGSRLASALALPLVTLPLAWRRDRSLFALVAVVAALLVDAALGGFLVGRPVVPLAAILLALYTAGRSIAGARGLAGAVVAMAVLVATRVWFDPVVDTAGDALVTLIVVPLPFLVGRWVRGQALLAAQDAQKAERVARDRERGARRAAEEERVRIAADLQAAVADALRVIIGRSQEVRGCLTAEDRLGAHRLFEGVADTAREALADVRRVLGILRRDGVALRLDPAGDPLIAGLADIGAPAAPDTAGQARSALPGDGPAVTRRNRGRRLTGARPDARWVDPALIVTLLLGAEIELVVTTSGDARTAAALAAGLIVAPLWWRRVRPLRVAAAVLAAVTVQTLVLDSGTFPAFSVVALTCAGYAIGAYAERRPAIAGLVLFAAGTTVHAAVFHPEAMAAALLGGATVPWIVGRIVRSRRLLTREARDKAERIELARVSDARAAAMAERVLVARELHDVVAHNMSVIAIQAAGADGIMERDPERAAQCASLIEVVAREALTELGRLVGVLASDGPIAASKRPTLAGVEALAARARASGLPVELRIEGHPATLPVGVDLAAFRIVQEALTNTSKHAGHARAWVTVRYGEHAIEVEIADDGPGPTATGDRATGFGHGLIGMRERVALYHGALDTGPGSSGGYLVRAMLPLAAA